MPKPLALEFVAVVDRTSRGVGVGAFDRLSEPYTNPEARTCQKTKDNPIKTSPAFLAPLLSPLCDLAIARHITRAIRGLTVNIGRHV
jgi:hypothetical protein